MLHMKKSQTIQRMMTWTIIPTGKQVQGQVHLIEQVVLLAQKSVDIFLQVRLNVIYF